MSDPTGAAHLTGTIQTSPSLFELLSVENFSSALHSAIHHIVKFFATRNPEAFGPVYRNFDELFLLLDAALQIQYLKTKRATLGEAFYGLERLRLIQGEKLSLVPSLLTSILIPYIKCKGRKFYDEIRENDSTEKWKKLFVKAYPILLAVLGTLKLYKYIRYCLGYTASHDFILHLLGLKVGYAQPTQQNLARPTKPLKWFLLTLGESVLWIVEIGSFFAQFLEGYTNKRGSLSSSSIPIPEFYEGTLNLDKTKCPLCHEKRKNSAALSTSGVTYCYSCIVKYLRTFQRCPVTNIPTNTDHIVRIFYT